VPLTARRATLFVYGSLLRGEINHGRLAGASFLREARTEPAFDLVDLGPYPALVRGGRTAVLGELYAVPPALLAALDAFEGHPDTYRRSRIHLDDGRRVDAYLCPPALAAGLPRVPGGSWRDRQNEGRTRRAGLAQRRPGG
jgi:gamma-glutamylaminecyclotransferase